MRPDIDTHREAFPRAMCANNLYPIAAALHAYHAAVNAERNSVIRG